MSVTPTYDSRETGPRYTTETRVNGRRINYRKLPDPFVRQTVTVGWPDLLRGLLQGQVLVQVIVGAETDLIEDVLELDANYNTSGRSAPA